jgi:serine/threonine-protein kinase RsbW
MEYRELAMRFVTSACKLVKSTNGSFHQQVISAFGEAFNNAVLHAYGTSAKGDIEIEVDPGTDRLVIRLMDYGRPFDIQGVTKPDLDSLPESGLGIFIMRSCMDDVTYTPGTPNVLTMTKFLLEEAKRSGSGT